MKTKIILLLALLLTFIHKVSAEDAGKSSKITGTWVLLSSKNGDLQEQFVSDTIPILYKKIFNGSHFCAVTYLKDGMVVRVIGGTYTLNGNEYNEEIEFSNIRSITKTKSTFTIEFEGDKMRVSGEVGGGLLKLKETWKKID